MPELLDRNELSMRWEAIHHALKHSPDKVLKIYEDTLHEASTPVVRTITHTFGPTMHWGKEGRRIREGAGALLDLSKAYAKLGAIDRALLLEIAVAELIALGVAADAGDSSQRVPLGSIGAAA